MHKLHPVILPAEFENTAIKAKHAIQNIAHKEQWLVILRILSWKTA